MTSTKLFTGHEAEMNSYDGYLDPNSPEFILQYLLTTATDARKDWEKPIEELYAVAILFGQEIPDNARELALARTLQRLAKWATATSKILSGE